MKFFIKDFFSKCDQIHSFLQIWSHFLKKSLMENFIFLSSDSCSRQRAGFFAFCTVIVSRCIATIGKAFLLWLLTVTSTETKGLPLKMGLPRLGVYYVCFYSPLTRRVFCILQMNVSRCIACYSTPIGKHRPSQV